MRWLPLLAALWSAPALAFTEPSAGGWVAAGGGLAIDSHAPFGVGPGWQASAGLWFGKHDNAYAIGKSTGVGLSLRQGLLRGELVSEPMLEVRRGADLFVVSTHVFAAAGPQLRAGDVGVAGLVGAGAKYRMDALVGLTARLELGASWIDGAVGFRGNVVVGVEFASPWTREERLR
jgi:hypothetical protein